ncbi:MULTISPECIES: carboxymuconolactone decarboxylase family protein [Sphingobium]|jgi:4-carboxymuconolactone decarboxylase|uniref:Carboxymuconolactone decarboxylase-like domain-containing protein n=1 Tax=Sphingobium baderi TaxID=1332080 RepID=A0A0S3EV86_9SPHN|nr:MULTISPECIES: carboxymuconolactone decarboxylase family protein [Sphingobium]ALR19344.1 hypothetical protein ATN00_02500 [Sphingobium baderi]
MTEDEMIARGKEIFEKCYGDVIAPPPVIESKALSGLAMKMFNDIWGNETLSFRDKRLIVLGIIAGLGADSSLFEIHSKSALRNGELNADELQAVLLTALPYVGFPRISPLVRIIDNAIAEHGS